MHTAGALVGRFLLSLVTSLIDWFDSLFAGGDCEGVGRTRVEMRQGSERKPRCTKMYRMCRIQTSSVHH